jgi:hypothetical protein
MGQLLIIQGTEAGAVEHLFAGLYDCPNVRVAGAQRTVAYVPGSIVWQMKLHA